VLALSLRVNDQHYKLTIYHKLVVLIHPSIPLQPKIYQLPTLQQQEPVRYRAGVAESVKIRRTFINFPKYVAYGNIQNALPQLHI
jgi:hypothetical protein